MKKILLACDLDNTLIYSYRHRKPEDICVEMIKEREQSFMTPKAYKLLKEVSERVEVVPVTTRSMQQYKRINLPVDDNVQYAITTNGAILLENNKIQLEWRAFVQNDIDNYMDEILEIMPEFADTARFEKCRIIDASYLFVYCNPDFDIEACADYYRTKTNMEIGTTGRKLYFFPPEISKGNAVKKLKNMLEHSLLICAGDSPIDASMLQEADIAVVPHFYDVSTLSCKDIRICEENKNFTEFVLETVYKEAVSE